MRERGTEAGDRGKVKGEPMESIDRPALQKNKSYLLGNNLNVLVASST